MAIIRKNVLNLPAQDETLVWFGRAITAMKQKPIADPTSWRYQAAIHDYDRASDPLASNNDVLPSSSDQSTFWMQCQHSSWFFLPWHRMYLHYFEQIVTAEIVNLNGPADWALPYWNYSANTAARLLPAALRSPTLADKSPNPLYVEQRDPRCNAGKQFTDARSTELSCLKEPDFDSASVGGDLGFGGPVTPFSHSGGVFGALEATPHNTMHGAVGGNAGWMSAFNTAPLDPTFWMHHANIDRLWQVWLNRDASHANATTNNWLSSVTFSFHDASGQVVTMQPSQVVDTTAAPFFYTYDDVSDPLAAAVAPKLEAAVARVPPALIGATPNEVAVGDSITHAAVPMQARSAVAPGTAGKRTFLNIENITSAKPAPAYDVYVNLPEGADPSQHDENYAGRVATFGLVESSRASGQHAGSGLHYVFNVTDLLQRLSTLPGWNPKEIRVSLVSTDPGTGASLRVGRISLYEK